jgi:hypothetical protein
MTLRAHVGKVSRSLVRGWALDTDRPDETIAVSILVDGHHVADTSADQPRPDLARLEGFGHGRHGFQFTFPQPLAADVTHQVSLRFAATGAKLPGGDHLLRADDAAPATPAAPMRPILVTGPGRSGTTLLMSLLAASPGIVAADLPPYETRQLAYYGNAHHVLTQPADTVRSTHQDRVHGDFYHIGFNPYNGPAHDQAFRTQALVQDFSAHYVPAQLDSAFAGLVREYYGRMARDHGKPGAALFAEKNNNLQRVVWQFVRRAFPGAREIVTVRDPRDVFCSYIAYFKVDGDYAFSDLCHATKVIAALRAERRDDVFFCRYEHLLRGDAAFLADLSAFLGTSIAIPPAQGSADLFARHATSATPHASLERWRTDMPAEWRDRCNAAWRPFLETFGYAPT